MAGAGLGMGSVIHMIEGEPSTYDVAGFDTLFSGSPIKIGRVSGALGDLGSTYEVSSYVDLETGNSTPDKGPRTNGTLSVPVVFDSGDAGQDEVRSGTDGAKKNSLFSFRITISTGDIFYFVSKIYSSPITLADASGYNMTLVLLKEAV